MNARRAAYDALNAILREGAYANLALKQTCAALEPQQAHRAAALVYTALDHLLTIDYMTSQLLDSPCKPAVRNILRLGICELFYMNAPAHAVVSEYVSLTKAVGKPALSGFVNAVLRRADRERGHLMAALPDDPLERLSIECSYPLWIVRAWTDAYGMDFARALMSAPPSPLEIRAQYPCTSDELLRELPNAARCKLDENCLRVSGVDPAALPAFSEGRMSVQGQSAMLCCRALGDCRGRRVLDACAAPGGKSAYIASLCQNDVSLTCFELHAHRKALLDATLARLHVKAETQQRDASVYDPALADQFDAVLLDAPCSGLGQTRGKPDIRYVKSSGDIQSLAAVQTALLDACAGYVRPDGVLLYATCTISKPENESQAAGFLARHGNFSLERMPIPVENDGMLQLLPNVHDTDGFFLARFKRCS